MDLLAKILQGLNNRKKTIALFIDLSKTFDSLNHDTLFKKLDWHGWHESKLVYYARETILILWWMINVGKPAYSNFFLMHLIKSHHFKLWWKFWPTVIDLQRNLLLNRVLECVLIFGILLFLVGYLCLWQFKKAVHILIVGNFFYYADDLP